VVKPEEIDSLLAVLRKHGVSRYRCGLDGALEVEFQGPDAMLGAEPAGVGTPLYPAPTHGPEEQAGGHRRVFAGMTAEDPLWDGVRNPSEASNE
jgi:hypothetical protein